MCITEITTVEGIIDRVIRGLEQDQEVRRKDHPETAEKIDAFISKLSDLKNLKAPFKLVSMEKTCCTAALNMPYCRF